jgi:hypothetical protein
VQIAFALGQRRSRRLSRSHRDALRVRARRKQRKRGERERERERDKERENSRRRLAPGRGGSEIGVKTARSGRRDLDRRSLSREERERDESTKHKLGITSRPAVPDRYPAIKAVKPTVGIMAFRSMADNYRRGRALPPASHAPFHAYRSLCCARRTSKYHSRL